MNNLQKDERVVEALEQIGKEANRAAEIIRRVRAFVQATSRPSPIFDE